MKIYLFFIINKCAISLVYVCARYLSEMTLDFFFNDILCLHFGIYIYIYATMITVRKSKCLATVGLIHRRMIKTCIQERD